MLNTTRQQSWRVLGTRVPACLRDTKAMGPVPPAICCARKSSALRFTWYYFPSLLPSPLGSCPIRLCSIGLCWYFHNIWLQPWTQSIIPHVGFRALFGAPGPLARWYRREPVAQSITHKSIVLVWQRPGSTAPRDPGFCAVGGERRVCRDEYEWMYGNPSCMPRLFSGAFP